MKVLLINGSVNKEKSTTLQIANAFIKGLDETVEVVNTIDLKMEQSIACYISWIKGQECAIKDDATEVLSRIKKADLVIWAVPLYAYGAPGHVKTLMDRTMSLNQPEMYLKEGMAHYYGYEDGSKKTVLISSGALPDLKGNFDGLTFEFKRMFGEKTFTICCPASALFSDLNSKPIIAKYLALVEQAGQEYRENFAVSKEIRSELNKPLIDKGKYIKLVNEMIARLKQEN